jgi:hypothetical protein
MIGELLQIYLLILCLLKLKLSEDTLLDRVDWKPKELSHSFIDFAIQVKSLPVELLKQLTQLLAENELA